MFYEKLRAALGRDYPRSGLRTLFRPVEQHPGALGVRIPALGCFDVVSRQIQVGEEAVTIHRPVFHPARNLIVVCNLSDNKAYLPGNKELEPLKYSKVAAAASVSRQKAAGCIQGTVSLLSYCLGKGENVAFVLKDIGVLLIEGTTVQMKFYYDFLEMLSGKENLEQVIFKVPRLLDMVVSRMVLVASLSFSGHVVIFPELEMEFVHKPPLRALLKTSRQVPGEDEQTRREFLPPLGQVPVGCPGFAAPSSPNQEPPQFREITGQKRKKIKSSVRQQPEILGDSSGEKQPGTGQAKGKAALKDRVSKQSRAQVQAATAQSCRGGGKGNGKGGGWGRGG
ncbi:coiled-coil domain-containing protein 81-like [Strix uralensis]|uniref:coiled-coil domain-containing protein 81-like n=1 Tax=Strix uralensis TaxID=36305 RepID=UPI003DA7933A